MRFDRMKIFDNLRFRLLLLVALAVIPALGVTLFSGIQLRQQARDGAVAETFRTIYSVSNYHDSIVEGMRQTMLALSLSPELRDPSLCNNYLRYLSAADLFSEKILVADTSGEVYCSSRDSNSFVSFSEMEDFQQAFEGGIFTIGDPLLDAGSSTSYLPLLLPVTSANRNEDFVLLAMLDLTVVVENEAIFNLPPKSAILITGQDGQVLMRYPEAEQWVGQRLPDSPVINEILGRQQEGSAEVAGIDGVLRFYAFTPLHQSSIQNTYLSVGIPSETVYAGSNAILWRSLTLLGLSSLLAAAVAFYGGDLMFLRVVSLTAERDAAENLLREANQKLEERVRQRTTQLAEVNQQLETELEERKRTVAMLRLREAELKRQQTLLERSNRDLQDFAYITSHDLQEPLRKIQAFGDRLSHRYHDQLGEDGALFIDRMVTSARRMQNMINDLLQYSRVTTRGGNFVRIPLTEVIEEVVQDLELRFRESGGKIELEQLPEIEADEVQMRQLFQNLIGNALKFHRPGTPPVIKISSKIEHLQPGDETPYAVVCVEDNGIGFEEKYLDRIFQPFQRLHSKDIYEGSGIGLAVCRKIINRHGGEITAQSILGQGSRFIITLPINHKEESEVS
jgi:signal transduction histidine kinase